MANITHCDKCDSIITSGFDHHATLSFLNPIKEKAGKNGYVTDNWEGDFCGNCLRELFMVYFGHLQDHLDIERFDLDF